MAPNRKSAEASRTFVYIGPTIFRTRLNQNAIFIGARSSVDEFLKAEFDSYPSAKHLIVPIEELSGAREKIKTTGNVLGRIYADLSAGMKK